MVNGVVGLGRAIGSCRNRSYDDLTYALLPKSSEKVSDDKEEFIFYHGDCSDVDRYKHHKVDENDIATLLGGGGILQRTPNRSLDVIDFHSWRSRVRGEETTKISGTIENVVALSKSSDEVQPSETNLINNQRSHDRSPGLLRRLRSKMSFMWQKNNGGHPRSSHAGTNPLKQRISKPRVQEEAVTWEQAAPYVAYPISDHQISSIDEDPTRPSFTALSTEDIEETQNAAANMPEAPISCEPPQSDGEELGKGVSPLGLPHTEIDLLQSDIDTAKKLALEKYVDKPLSCSGDIDWEAYEVNRREDEALAIAQNQTGNDNTRAAPLAELPVQDFATQIVDFGTRKADLKERKQSSVREWLVAQNNEVANRAGEIEGSENVIPE